MKNIFPNNEIFPNIDLKAYKSLVVFEFLMKVNFLFLRVITVIRAKHSLYRKEFILQECTKQ